MRGISCSDDQWVNSYRKMSFSCSSRKLMVNYADVIRKNCVKEATVPFRGNKRFKSYEKKCECLDFTENS